MKKNKILLIGLILLLPINAKALEKEETVYSKLNNDGTVKNIIVTEHIINKEKKSIIEDITDLENIKSLNLDKPFKLNDNRITFNTNKEDIYYQGNSKKELPIKETITYRLDGKDISLDDLLGKSGRVEINIKYTNISKNIVNINNRQEVLYTPFVVSTITNIDGKNNSNIKVTNGKVIDNGIGYLIVGLSTPGLYESLELDELKNLDYITIEFDTKKFSLASIYSVITPKIIDSNDLTIFNKLNNMYKDADKLQTSMNKIQDGSLTILSNLNKISEGTDKISYNLNLVLDNLEKIKNGTIELDNGLSEIVSKLEESQEEFNNMDAKINQIKYLISKNNSSIEKLENVKNSYEYLSSLSTIPEDKQTEYISLKSIYEGMNLSSDDESMIYLLKSNNMALSSSIEALNKVKSSVSELNIYLPKLKEGSGKLSEGTSNLRNGVATLNEKMQELNEGTIMLRDGMSTLNTGIETFNNEGIVNITNLSNKLSLLSNKTNELIKLSNNYQSFSIKDDSYKSNTKFVLIVDSKEYKEKENKKVKDTKAETLIDRIKNLFK